jgi:hypothetical protein
MNKGKRRVCRLALYLCSIGIHPNATGTQSQYDQLEQQQRKLARRTGRQLIVEFGSIAKALAIASHAVQEALPANSISVLPRTRSRQEQFLDNLSRWSPLTPPCPSCRMGNGFPKRSWPTREWADEVWGRQHDRDTLRIFECPVQPGFWHLGHVSRRPVSPATTINTFSPSIPPCHPPNAPLKTGGRA